MTAAVAPSQPSIAPEKIRGGIALIEAAISNMAATKTALGYNEMDMKNLARFVFANWKYVEAESASLKARIQELESALLKSNDALSDWLAFAEEELGEFDLEVCEFGEAAETLCHKCQSAGCINLKIRNTRAALEAKPAGGMGA